MATFGYLGVRRLIQLSSTAQTTAVGNVLVQVAFALPCLLPGFGVPQKYSSISLVHLALTRTTLSPYLLSSPASVSHLPVSPTGKGFRLLSFLLPVPCPLSDHASFPYTRTSRFSPTPQTPDLLCSVDLTQIMSCRPATVVLSAQQVSFLAHNRVIRFTRSGVFQKGVGVSCDLPVGHD